MTHNPLDWFLHEKIAAVAADSEPKQAPYRIPRDISRSSPDVGERALAGILAVSGSLAGRATPIVGRMVGSFATNMTSKPWDQPPVRGAASFNDVIDSEFNRYVNLQPTQVKGRVGGLLDVNRTYPAADPAMIDANLGRLDQLSELVGVADSFIDKHDLKAKGVRLNLQDGPLSGMGGGSYRPATKEVTLPRLSNELALHELGHAADYATRVGRVRAIAEPILSKAVLTALPIALAAGDHIKEMLPGTVDDRVIEFMQDNAPGIMAATLAATSLYPEAKASMYAIRHIRDLERLGKQPVGATARAAKRLLPMFGSYVIGAVPAVVGMALARKYMREARDERKERPMPALDALDKTASFMSGLRDIGAVGKALGQSSIDLIRQPGTAQKILASAKHIGTSPEFIHGALGAAIPATLGALYMYGTDAGRHMQDKLDPVTRDKLLRHDGTTGKMLSSADETWRREHPLQFAGVVAMGSALAGGVIAKVMSDLTRVL